MFNDSDSFFYSPTGDLTNTLQRQFSGKYDTADPLWKRVRNGSIHDTAKVQRSVHVFLSGSLVVIVSQELKYTICYCLIDPISRISNLVGDDFLVQCPLS